jgi:O-antigen ligase
MNARRTFTICLHALLWVLPLVTIFSGKLTTPVLILCWLWLMVAGRNQLRSHEFWRTLLTGREALILLIIMAWPLVMAWHSFTPERSFSSALNVLLTLFIGAMTLALARHHAAPFSLKATVSSLLAGLLVPVGLALVENTSSTGGAIYHLFVALTGPMPYEEFRAGYMEKAFNRSLCLMTLMLWPVVYGVWQMQRKWLAYLLPLLLMPALFTMDSTSAQLSLLAGIIIFHSVRWFPRALPPLLAVTLVAFLIAWPRFYPVMDEYLETHSIYEDLPRSAQHRLAIWRFALDHVEQKPWLGWGFDTARALPGGSEEFAPGMQWMPLHPHNSVLQILVEEGAVGLFLTLLALGIVLRAWIRLCRANPAFGAAMGAALYGHLIIGFTTFGVWQVWWLATPWLVLLLFRWFARGQAA